MHYLSLAMSKYILQTEQSISVAEKRKKTTSLYFFYSKQWSSNSPHPDLYGACLKDTSMHKFELVTDLSKARIQIATAHKK